VSRWIVGYITVSTAKQNRSGLELEVQKAALVRFAAAEGFELAAEYVEFLCEKGGDSLDRRPQLVAALAEARKLACPVIVAKLDRLSKDIDFISALMTQKVPFVVAQSGTGIDAFTLRLYTALARKERALISQRTRQGLKAAKPRAVRLGRPRLDEIRPLAWVTTKAEGDRFATKVLPAIREIQASGVATAGGIARALNARGVATARGGKWSPVQVIAILRRVGG
jgi:DNA invertase Pin-like site-specific DNA recombinase